MFCGRRCAIPNHRLGPRVLCSSSIRPWSETKSKRKPTSSEPWMLVLHKDLRHTHRRRRTCIPKTSAQKNGTNAIGMCGTSHAAPVHLRTRCGSPNKTRKQQKRAAISAWGTVSYTVKKKEEKGERLRKRKETPWTRSKPYML